MDKITISKVVEDFKRTGLYAKKFLKDLESGLKKSSYIYVSKNVREKN